MLLHKTHLHVHPHLPKQTKAARPYAIKGITTSIKPGLKAQPTTKLQKAGEGAMQREERPQLFVLSGPASFRKLKILPEPLL